MSRALLLLCLFLTLAATAQTEALPDSIKRKRLTAVAVAGGVVYTSSMVALHQMWYADYETGKFRFFDDSDEWLGMDKAGHALTAYQVSRYGYEVLSWSGLEDRKAAWWGTGVSLVFMTNIEVFDAFSEGWGFSWSDFGANLAGAGLFLGQQLAWEEQRLMLKFSYSPTDLAALRPETLGSSDLSRIFKDYNGQTIWLSASPGAFMGEGSFFPPWLCLSFGYGGHDMLGGSYNPAINDAGRPLPELEPYRQFYLSLDIDLTRIPTKSAFLRTAFDVFGFLKIPAPAVEFSRGEARWHWMHF
jgi:uncharacterized protein YfiM (DUF2279 family)